MIKLSLTLIFICSIIAAAAGNTPLAVVVFMVNFVLAALCIGGFKTLIETRSQTEFIYFAAGSLQPLKPISYITTSFQTFLVIAILGTFLYCHWLLSMVPWFIFGIIMTTLHTRSRKFLTPQALVKWLQNMYQLVVEVNNKQNLPTEPYSVWIKKFELKKAKTKN